MSYVSVGPKSLFAPTEFLSGEQCKALFDRIVSLTKGGGETSVSILSRFTGGATWVRNRVHLTQSVTGLVIEVRRLIHGSWGLARTTRMDDDGLADLVRRAEASLIWDSESPERWQTPVAVDEILRPVLWSDTTYAMSGAQRGDLAQRLIEPVEAAGLLSAGELLITGKGHAALSTRGDMFRYYPVTQVACSMTVRDAKGTASGWAGQTHYDISRIDPVALGARALDKCIKSANPMRIEPGYYTTILEPQAVADLLEELMGGSGQVIDRTGAEGMIGPFKYKPGRSKIGQQVLDRRLTLRSDPMDADAGFVPFTWNGEAYSPVSWIADGFLRELMYRRDYARSRLLKARPLPSEGSFRLSSNTPAVTVDDMIKSTQRGILVTRLHGVDLIDRDSLLCGGYTRDGLWLIQNGKITHPIKNFRFTESPLFALNRIEAIGTPVRVFDQEHARVVPPIKVRDFSFTSLADAV